MKKKSFLPDKKAKQFGDWKWTKTSRASKVEKISEDSLDLIPSPSVRIQIMGGKLCLRYKGKTLLGDVNKLLKAMFCLYNSSKLSCPWFEYRPVWIFTVGEGIKSRLPFEILSTLRIWIMATLDFICCFFIIVKRVCCSCFIIFFH